MFEIVVVLALLGAVLIVFEFFVPGGVLGFFGGLCLFIVVVLCYAYFGLVAGTVSLILAVLYGGSAFYFMMNYFPETSLGKKFVLESSIMGTGMKDDKTTLLNCEGVAVTVLRPSGKVLIQGKRFDVVAETGMIPKDAPVKVVLVEGSKIVVRQTSAQSAQSKIV